MSAFLSSQRAVCERPARRLSTGPQSTASRAQGHDYTLPHLNKYPSGVLIAFPWSCDSSARYTGGEYGQIYEETPTNIRPP